ncbi:VanZ family protein [Herbiconiux sp. P18]|uniref:VanZ family protein n=1 Tax=Herbiconiux liangxiaofengii TaxID=3342795 RepID=UPI0035B74565
MFDLALNLLFAAVLATVSLVAVGRGIVPTRVQRMPLVLLALIWAAAVAFMTLRPGSGLGMRLNLLPLQFDGSGSELDAVLNTFVFVPLGLVMVLAGARIRTVFWVALASTLTIEVTQYVTDLGRTADVNDVITNTAGALLGGVLMLGLRRAVLALVTPSLPRPIPARPHAAPTHAARPHAVPTERPAPAATGPVRL